MFIIAGLGNPSKEYDKTRHNAGFDTVDYLADRHGIYMGEKKTKVVFSEPKTIKSIRKVPIAETLLKKLREIKCDYSENSFILTGTEERFIEPITYRFTYKKCLKNCNVSYKKFHCLRHTFATRCIRAGMDAKSLSEVLGHNNVDVTLSIYVHSSYKIKKKYIDKI